MNRCKIRLAGRNDANILRIDYAPWNSIQARGSIKSYSVGQYAWNDQNPEGKTNAVYRTRKGEMLTLCPECKARMQLGMVLTFVEWCDEKCSACGR